MNTTPAPEVATSSSHEGAQLARHIEQDVSACESLLQLMQAEQQALQERDADSLGQIIEQKAQFLIQLEQSAVRRSEWAKQAQAGEPESAWTQLLEDLQQPELLERWQTLKSLMTECREQNEINGRMLARSQQTFGRLLNIMRGQTEAPSLYTEKGARSAGGSNHTFGEA